MTQVKPRNRQAAISLLSARRAVTFPASERHRPRRVLVWGTRVWTYRLRSLRDSGTAGIEHASSRSLVQCHHTILNNHVGPPHCRAEMYAGRVTCCPLVSYSEYADRQTDARPYITLDAASAINSRANWNARIKLSYRQRRILGWCFYVNGSWW